MSMPIHVRFLIHSLSNIAVLYICVICGFLEGLMEDWFHQMSNPRKIKNLLTLLTYFTIYIVKTKAQISCAVTAQLICVFVFANAKRRFSHGAAHFPFGPLRSMGIF